ncbi:MAG: TIR domain-containing protein, partial [Taibaiella sp.]|nr:TIR domain-containing protein [Taibaiella sp.]
MRIFISYSSKDREQVALLANDLQTLGNEVWFDTELTRTGGQKWWYNILTNLRQCDLFIFALTPNSLSSDPCKREYEYAQALRRRILPVMLQSIDILILPIALQELQFVDYREHSAKQGIALAATLQNLPPAQPLPNPLPPEPQTPLTPLAQLSEYLDAPSLTNNEQIEILFELERFLSNTSTLIEAETLLNKLYARDDLFNRVAEKISRLLPTISEAQNPGQATPDKTKIQRNSATIGTEAHPPSTLQAIKPLHPALTGHNKQISCVTFSPDGKHLASSSGG